VEVIETLLTYGADINQADRDGDTALFAAIEREHKQITRLLLARGANALVHRKNGDTPMDLAIKKKAWDIVALMLLYIPAPHERNIAILKKKRKCILQAAKHLMQENQLAMVDRSQIVKAIKKISIKHSQQIKSTKFSELSRRNGFFSEPKIEKLEVATESDIILTSAQP
jgi:ankyrin repeat protein